MPSPDLAGMPEPAGALDPGLLALAKALGRYQANLDLRGRAIEDADRVDEAKDHHARRGPL